MNIAIRIIVELIKHNRPDKLKVHPDLLLYLPDYPKDLTSNAPYTQTDLSGVYYAPNSQTLAVKVSGQSTNYHYTRLVT